MKHCSTCDHEIKDHVRFCPYCGSAVAKLEGSVSVGTVLEGKFRIDKTLRESEPTSLFVATQITTDIKVIIELVPRRLIESIGLEVFSRHLHAAAKIRNRFVAAIDYVGLAHVETPFLVLEYFDGLLLADKLRQGAIDPIHAVWIIRQIGSALDAAHLAGVPLCAPSPEGVWLTGSHTSPDVKLTDHTVSPLLAAEAVRLVKESGSDLPRLRYASPEILSGQDGSPLSDVYSLGVIAYEMIAGELPFQGLNAFEALAIGAHPKPLRESVQASSEFNDVLQRALSIRPEDRQPSVTVLAEELQKAIEREPVAACAVCGAVVAPTALFCRRCGSPQPQAPSLASELFFRKEVPTASLAQSINEAAPADGAHYADKEQPIYYDDNVQFTVYRPRAVKPLVWTAMLAFAHLSEKRPNAPADAPDPIAEVQRQARQVLGEQMSRYQQTSQDSSQAVPREGEITFIPDIPGVEFNPPSRTFRWVEDIHKEEFRMRAAAHLDQQSARGRLSVFLGSLLLAEVVLRIRVDSNQAIEAQTRSTSAQPYRKIFASYSHKDIEVVEQFEHYAKALGDRYLRDVKDLRAGEVWSDQLGELISEANVFQLFWSSNSMKSEFVRQEWQHALALRRDNFIRPTYWEDPLPTWPERNLPPAELVKLHFQQIAPVISDTWKAKDPVSNESFWGMTDLPTAASSPTNRPQTASPTDYEIDAAERNQFAPAPPVSARIIEQPSQQSGARLSTTGNPRDTIASRPQSPIYPPMAPPPTASSRGPIAIFIVLGCLGLAAVALLALLFVLRMFQ